MENQNQYEKNRTVIYVSSLAFIKCDCGKELVLAQTRYGDPTYRGDCECGKSFCLRHNKLWEREKLVVS